VPSDFTDGMGPLFELIPIETEETRDMNFTLEVGVKSSSLFENPTSVTINQSSYRGFIQYSDPDNVQVVPANARTLLDLTGLAPTVNNLEDDVSPHVFMNAGKFDPFGDTPFGKYRIRLNFTATPSVINAELLMELDIGGVFGTIDSDPVNIFTDAGNPQKCSASFDFYTGSTAIANGGEIYITSTNPITITSPLVVVIVEAIS